MLSHGKVEFIYAIARLVFGVPGVEKVFSYRSYTPESRNIMHSVNFRFMQSHHNRIDVESCVMECVNTDADIEISAIERRNTNKTDSIALDDMLFLFDFTRIYSGGKHTHIVLFWCNF